MQAFLDLLDALGQLPALKHLFILGDWFETWLGDDVAATPAMADWLAPMIRQLQNLSNTGCQIYVMHGNRDFLVGQKFCDAFNGRLIQEPFYIAHQGVNVRLEHGDALCTDDKAYQRFRKIIQHPVTKKLLLALPSKKRQQIAQDLRQKSKSDTAKKSMHIMDVNDVAVAKALENVDILIHGHTHRPAEHGIKGKKRLVLGDWRTDGAKVQAVIGVAVAGQPLSLVMAS